MRMQLQEGAWNAAHKIVAAFHGCLLTESERVEAFRLVYAEVLGTLELFEFRLSRERKRLAMIPPQEDTPCSP